MPYLSILIPVYNEEQNVLRLYLKIKQILKYYKETYEIIFVDDGSKDRTSKILEELSYRDEAVKTIVFRRNFGKSAALSAGFSHAKGEIIITMDGDLQDDPNEIPRFIKALRNYDMVSGWKFKRKDPITKTLPSLLFNNLTSVITGIKMHDFNCGFKAYRKKVVKDLKIYGEMHRYIPALAHWKGYKVGEIPVKHHARKFGKSKYGAGRLIKGLLDLITVKFMTTYLKRPLHFFGFLGLGSMILGSLTGLYLVFEWIMGKGIGTRPLLMLAVLLIILGVQFISMGLIAEMITMNNQKNEKNYSVKRFLR